MNKLLKSIVAATVGVAMAIGAGVGLGREAKAVYAESTYNQIDSLTAGDEVLIVTTKSNINYVLPAANTTSSPSANLTVTISNNSIAADLDNNLFTVGGENDAWTFKNSSGSFLYTTSSNSGVRVGNTSDTWKLISKTNGYAIQEKNNSRFLGIYQTSDWRSYTTSNASNYGGSGEAIRFFKKAPATSSDFSLDKTSVALAVGGSSINVTATPNEFVADNANYSWNRTSGDDCIELTNENTPTVTITPKNNINSSSCELTVAVTGCTSKTITVTVTKPSTVAEARTAIDGAGNSAIPNSFVKGLISQVDSFNETYNSITYWISDDGTTSNQLEVYSGKGLFGADFTAATNIKVGAEVIVCGTLQMHNSTYEFDKNNYLVSYVASDQPDIPEPAVETKTIAEFIELDNTRARAYIVTGTIKSWTGGTKNESGNFTLTDGTKDLIIYGSTANATELVWDNVGSYIFSNPKDFLDNEITASINLGDIVTMKLIRDDYHETIQGKGIVTNVQHVQTTLTDITLSSSTLTLTVGQNSNLLVSPVPANAELGVVEWTSNNEDVATVENGTVTALTSGSATITAVAGGFSKNCLVTVNAAPKTDIEQKGPFVKITDDSGIISGAQYLVAYEDGNLVFDGTLSGGEKPFDLVGNYKSTGDLSNFKDAFFTITATDGGYSIKSNSGYYIGQTANDNGLLSNKETIYTNTISFTNGNVDIKSSGGAYLRYNSASNQTRFRYYKSSSYTAQKAIQLYRLLTSPATSIATIRGTESGEGSNTVVDSLDLRFGIKIATSVWKSISSNGWTIQEYGVMMYLATEEKVGTTSVRERYNASASNVSVGRRDTGVEPDQDGQGNYNFTVKVNVPDSSWYDYYFCVRPYVKIGEQIIWLLGDDIQESVRTMADGHNSGTNFSEDALNYLKTAQ